MKNTFGSALALTIFGESHGRAIGGVLDGMAAGVPVDEEFMPPAWISAAPGATGFRRPVWRPITYSCSPAS